MKRDTNMTVKIGKAERVDSHMTEADVFVNGENVGNLIRNWDADPHALSMTTRRGPFSNVEVYLWLDDSCFTSEDNIFYAEDYEGCARKTVTAAKQWIAKVSARTRRPQRST